MLDARRQPLHEGGIKKQPGIYFAGMDLAVTRKSGTVLAVQDESARLVEYIKRHGVGAGPAMTAGQPETMTGSWLRLVHR